MIIKDYYGNPIDIPSHMHTVEDTQRNGTTAMATETADGFIDKSDIVKIDQMINKANEIDSYLRRMIFIKSATLLTGNAFASKLKSVAPNATSVIFTKTGIPADKIAGATIVSIPTSENNIYMYLNGTTVYVSPETDDTIIYCTDAYHMFYGLSKLQTIDMDNFDTTKTTTINGMFGGCSALTTLKLNFNNTSNINNMGHLFNGCTALKSVDLSGFNTSNVTTMTYMFANCPNLTSIGNINFDFTNVTITSHMFFEADSLSGSITVNSGNIATYTNMFRNCAITAGSAFTVNYTAAGQTIAPKLVATKGATPSNIILGTLVS